MSSKGTRLCSRGVSSKGTGPCSSCSRQGGASQAPGQQQGSRVAGAWIPAERERRPAAAGVNCPQARAELWGLLREGKNAGRWAVLGGAGVGKLEPFHQKVESR